MRHRIHAPFVSLNCTVYPQTTATLKDADTSKTRRARLFDGSVLAVHEQEKHSATKYCAVYPSFKSQVKWLLARH